MHALRRGHLGRVGKAQHRLVEGLGYAFLGLGQHLGPCLQSSAFGQGEKIHCAKGKKWSAQFSKNRKRQPVAMRIFHVFKVKKNFFLMTHIKATHSLFVKYTEKPLAHAGFECGPKG